MNAGALAVAVALLLANAFFVASEFALVASRRTRIDQLAEEGSNRARLAQRLSGELSFQLAGAQLGITMASLGLGFVAEPAVADLLESVIEPIAELPEGLLHTLSFVVALAIVVFFHMVVGEMVPKNIAIAAPEQALLWLSLPTRAYSVVFRPVIRALNAMANGVLRLMRVEPRDELAVIHSADELASMLAASRKEGLLEEFEHRLLDRALVFGGREVAAIMVPRDLVRGVPRTATVAEAEQVALESGHSRLVVHGRDLDQVLGFVHAKDLLAADPAERDRSLVAGRIRRMLVVPENLRLRDLLLSMRRARIHVALVVEAQGRTAGLVTLEDVLEELVGEIADEHDVPASPAARARRRAARRARSLTRRT